MYRVAFLAASSSVVANPEALGGVWVVDRGQCPLYKDRAIHGRAGDEMRVVQIPAIRQRRTRLERVIGSGATPITPAKGRS
jgi:hypothetical protein